MKAFVDRSQTPGDLRQQIIISVLTLITLLFAPATPAQSSREGIEGVQNFGRVTDRYFRGGAVTPTGITRLAAMGVRTIVDLRDKESPGEAEACQQNGIRYFKFPMNGHVTPDDKAVSEILSIIQNAREPVYVHCSAGKHRTGTIAALYRIRVQRASSEQAWAEQQSYGFGAPEEHAELYAYVYKESGRPSGGHVVQVASRSLNPDDDKSSKKKKKDETSSKTKKKDEDKDNEDDDDRHDKAKREDQSDKVKRGDRADTDNTDADAESKGGVDDAKAAAARKSASSSRNSSLSAEVEYIPLADAIKRAKGEGGSGDVLKIDLEWDTVRSLATWDVTFSSGTEYEIEATTGNLLGTKAKAPAKLAVLLPLALDRGPAKGLLTFQDIIRKAEAGHGKTVMEMELKRLKGRSETMFEVVLADGTTLYYDAATGNAIGI